MTPRKVRQHGRTRLQLLRQQLTFLQQQNQQAQAAFKSLRSDRAATGKELAGSKDRASALEAVVRRIEHGLPELVVARLAGPQDAVSQASQICRVKGSDVAALDAAPVPGHADQFCFTCRSFNTYP